MSTQTALSVALTRSSLQPTSIDLPAAAAAAAADSSSLDSYSGHLLIDTACHHHAPSERQQLPFFDASRVEDTTPWWSHLLPSAAAHQSTSFLTPPSQSLMTAEDMFRTYVDPYAQFRQRLVYTQSQQDEEEELTPPGQLYQRFNYEDALLEMSAEMPTFPVLAAEHLLPHVTKEDVDTPPELIEAAVAALMTRPATAPSDMSTANVEWDTPMSAVQFDAADFHESRGVMRSRSHTVGQHVASAPWYTALPPLVPTPEAYQLSQGLDGSGDEVHQCQWLGCHQILPSASALTAHVNRQHIARRQPAHRCLWQGCNRAEHVFRHRDKILIHIRLHTNDRPYECDFFGCGKQFSRADSLDAHKKVHAAEGKSWHCRAQGCSRTYFHAKSLKKHERTAHDLDLE